MSSMLLENGLWATSGFLEFNLLLTTTDAIEDEQNTSSKKNTEKELQKCWQEINRQGDAKKAAEFLSLHPDIDVNNIIFAGTLPIRNATDLGNVEFCKMLLAHKADPNLPGSVQFWHVHFQCHAPHPLPLSKENEERIKRNKTILDLLLCYDYKPTKEDIQDCYDFEPIPSETTVIPYQHSNAIHRLTSISDLLKNIPVLGTVIGYGLETVGKGIIHQFSSNTQNNPLTQSQGTDHTAYPPYEKKELRENLKTCRQEIKSEKEAILTQYKKVGLLQKKLAQDCVTLIYQFALDKNWLSKLNQETFSRRQKRGHVIKI